VRISKIAGLGGSILAVGLLATAGIRLLDRHPVGNVRVPEPARPVDLKRYLGRWYEIARYEQRFERGCEGVTADYSLRTDGKIDVLNRCRKGDGKVHDAHGIAKVVDRASNAKLKVSFFGPFYGNYWVLDHADDYSWSIVGEPSGRYLWLLARDAELDVQAREGLVGRARALGYDTNLLVGTKQP
jgi:apolipoprotein D and lipocalin family protein